MCLDNGGQGYSWLGVTKSKMIICLERSFSALEVETAKDTEKGLQEKGPKVWYGVSAILVRTKNSRDLPCFPVIY